MLWLHHLRNQWNNPSRSDYYVMRLIATVHNIMAKKAIGIDDVKIDFKLKEDSSPDASQEHRENLAAMAKAAWSMRLGIDLNNVKPEDGVVKFGFDKDNEAYATHLADRYEE